MTAVGLLPYADFLGISLEGERDGAPLLVMPFSEGLIGAPGRLHGGAIAGLLEIAAIAAIDATLEDGEPARSIFKPITVTVDFMRPGLLVATYACGEVVRVGGRIANVGVSAWQEDPARPIAAARMNLAIAQPRAD
ncbi:PaaI family thioesterase [Sphingomonas nostoxanthinifaciens]|uniref:PaaI family thioesterase n=1 Tax=Sphingomonas nostoxanthinifaciens TaxID=2872652 RepID=UPI001CC21FEA|nr:PaaI family thioesterase [Sphingomonas nostoxanthinifaciens]